ncbi:MAG: hypothetical protein HQK81_02525 [Desulfovibrionaceae bacterium]|nr:hypothetical protein [Desulfovibrionaceae bacterium]MBF0512920.1 hypothetical protein [Desulfovibrionaceae bacterium]
MNRVATALLLIAAALTGGCGNRWSSPLINFPSFSEDGDNYAQMAKEIVRELDGQIAPRMGIAGNRNAYNVAVTVPANLHSLDKSSALARVMAQEIASNLVALGYNVQEMRKGREILFDRTQGALYLTGNVRGLARPDVAATLVVVGSFSPAPGGTRFSIECLDARNNNTVAMASRTVSAGPGADDSFGGARPGNGLTPSVVTTQGKLTTRDFKLP